MPTPRRGCDTHSVRWAASGSAGAGHSRPGESQSLIRKLTLCLAIVLAVDGQASPGQLNVLMIIVDDLAPVASAYGGPVATPALEQLAEQVFVLPTLCQRAGVWRLARFHAQRAGSNR